MNAIRVPPGRSGRQWLRGRLGSAEHAAALLEQKLRALRTEQGRLAEAAAHTHDELLAQAERTKTWTLRAALTAGRRGMRLACTGAEADVTISWSTTAGVRHPTGVTCSTPSGAADVPTGTAVARAVQEQRRMLGAALQHAVAASALRRLTAETDTTQRRVRVLRRHWVPLLRKTLAHVELELEEREQAENLRHRVASHTGQNRETE
ncbi:V-type ATP synthase subunit D [Lentzea sp. HUAS12]|uniref:V-type ATP synthase subunit D n=1 Tax=Lentzea sp. HUAS12 TaxID=2951806 RepID=UPI00209E0F7B|nr:V-type ATP synthase subunit D [Lentzea sp. HUAS12]USX53927.1 V-type ATP synthase subunit D [Lentzea sp. HUAS12]